MNDAENDPEPEYHDDLEVSTTLDRGEIKDDWTRWEPTWGPDGRISGFLMRCQNDNCLEIIEVSVIDRSRLFEIPKPADLVDKQKWVAAELAKFKKFSVSSCGTVDPCVTHYCKDGTEVHQWIALEDYDPNEELRQGENNPGELTPPGFQTTPQQT